MFDKKYLNTLYTCFKSINYYPEADELDFNQVLEHTYKALANSMSNEEVRVILNNYFFLYKYQEKAISKIKSNKRKWHKLVSQPRPNMATSNVTFETNENFYIINDLSKNGDMHDFLLINSDYENCIKPIKREDNHYFITDDKKTYLINNVESSPKSEIRHSDNKDYYELRYNNGRFNISGSKLPGWKIYKPTTGNLYYVVEDNMVKNNEFLIKNALCAFVPLTCNNERDYNLAIVKSYKKINDEILLSLLGALINKFIFEDLSEIDPEHLEKE